jgi:nitrite reductase/ring-hydroxylating ferredoxin subunit/uncharacterized membrane protein
MTLLRRTLERAASRIERADRLDPIADRIATVGAAVFPDGPVNDAASGTVFGHPLHPALVAVPTGAFLAASYLDFAGGPQSRPAARRLIAFGGLAALPAALAGASDWLDTEGAERRVGLVHATVNYAALSLYGISWLLRGRDRRAAGVGFALAGAAALSSAGWLGGHLAYALGVGVDTTAFQHLPTEWTDVAAEEDVPEGLALSVTVDGVPILLTRADGLIRAIADRCTHRGGPLHEGEIKDGCVTCPWHDSRFSLVDGSVVRGPATRPQSALEVRLAHGRVTVRRGEEVRTLRTNPVGP